jgi:hypothetical protein
VVAWLALVLVWLVLILIGVIGIVPRETDAEEDDL